MIKKESTYLLGLALFYHDSSSCVVKDGVVIAAAQEERFTRLKHDENFPTQAIEYCLKEAGIALADIDGVCFYEKPLWKFERLLLTYIQEWPRGFISFLKAMRAWLSQKLWMEHIIRKELLSIRTTEQLINGVTELSKEAQKSLKVEIDALKIYYVPHHLSHAASTYYPSGFDDATVLTVDGVGEWSTTSLAVGKGAQLTLKEEMVFPDSLGLLYSAFTYYLGFKVNSGEYKVMGLAPYGEAKYTDKIWELLDVFEDGSFRLKPQFFAYRYGLRMTSKKFVKHFGKAVRQPEDELTQWHKDVAASLQLVTEELMLKLTQYAQTQYGGKNLCLSGGVALNCVANGRIVREGPFENVYVFPAAGDAGGSVGAALYVQSILTPKQKLKTPVETIYLGNQSTETEINDFLQGYGIKAEKMESDDRADIIAAQLEDNQVIGLFQGRMEFGPRALGNRSIIADPRQNENWKRVNLKIKFREDFRPFAPSVMADKADEIFELNGVPSPYMLLTAGTKAKNLPAITHVNNSARIQTVTAKENQAYYDILSVFNDKTGCPVVINTSFNVRGEPIVCDHVDAFKCFIRTDMDVLVLENFMIKAEDIDKEAFKNTFELEVFEDD